MLTVKLKDTENVFLVREELEIAISYFNAFCYCASRIKVGDTEIVMPKRVYDTAKDLTDSYEKTIKSIGGFLIHE